MKLRRAAAEDCRAYWDLANDPGVRGNAFTPDPIAWDDHVRWFHEKLACPRSELLVIEEEGRSLGQVRLDYDSDGNPEIAIAIVESQRGKGHGARALMLAKDWVESRQGAQEILARIRVENTPSLAAFRKAGYQEVGRERVKGFDAIRMVCSLGGAGTPRASDPPHPSLRA